MYNPYHHHYRNPMAAAAVSALRRVSARTWLIIGGVVVGILGLLTWAGIAMLSWLWGQVPAAATAGNRLFGEAMTTIEQAAPGLKEEVGQWVPGLKEQVEQVAPGLKDQVGQWVPGLKEQVEQLAPGLAVEPPASDVSGTDLGPVPRFAGLARSAFTRRGDAVEVRYAGPAAFEAVRAHYLDGFIAAGYAQEVVDATPDAENHRFTAGQETIELSLQRLAAGRVEVRLKTRAQ